MSLTEKEEKHDINFFYKNCIQFVFNYIVILPHKKIFDLLIVYLRNFIIGNNKYTVNIHSLKKIS